METFELKRNEMLELAKVATFHLDDRLVPYSREDLRAEAWLQGFCFAKRHQKTDKEDNAAEPLPRKK